ncbi:helix-turn-helix transcriptional regulator [Bosea sp. 124]|uniref:helix-turn-helix domain-containing protein n=1 Tax=Bosea sp. 124 TaxID=2135642 RepID=UPI000D3D3CD2|nr:helix-turn-helix transcriptional regulator [Bosea sp. 124]PTM40139.1 DNA-binding XRE family transcriptional regulator [Bosea sp. 124]
MNRHHQPSVGHLIRDWRQLRRLSQLDLALEAEISQKHLSFVESGRSQPSRDMVLLLAEHLGVPLRERNALLLAGGYAPVYLERALEDPGLQAAKSAIDLVLKGHEPFPALAVDRHWTLLAANAAVAPLLSLAADPDRLRPPVNVLRLSLHPDGLAPAIANLEEWRSHLLARLRQQVRATADPILADLLAELSSYPVAARPGRKGHASDPEEEPAIVVPLRLRVGDATLSFISTTTVFGTPVDITLSELALETFFPADSATARALHAMAEAVAAPAER